MPFSEVFRGLFRADGLSWIMAGLIVFVVGNVLAYSRRYLAGDRNQSRHRRKSDMSIRLSPMPPS